MPVIRNLGELARSAMHSDALRIVEAGILSADPRRAVRSHVKLEDGRVVVGGREFELSRFGRVLVLGFGKASGLMAKGLEEALGDAIDGGYVIVPRGSEVRGLKRVRLLPGNHPVPGGDTIRSSLVLLKAASEAGERDLVFVLVSGGGSALFEVPREGVSLEDLVEVNRLLLRSGADIKEVNTVRKHISAVKGGQLAKALHPAKVVTLIVSDVVGDPPEFVASGPTVPDPTTYRDAYEVLRRYGLLDKVPRSVLDLVNRGLRGEVPETPKEGDEAFRDALTLIVASNRTALSAMKRTAESLGYNAAIVTSFMEGEAREVGRFIAGVMKHVSRYGEPVPKPAALLFGGETTVTVTGSGVGGRNQELALSVAIHISGLRGAVFASVGSDGIDGPTDAAGAVVDGGTVDEGREAGLDAVAYLADNDSYSYFKRLGRLVITGPTGTNVNDLAVALVR